MAVNRGHLRQISRNAYGAAGVAPNYNVIGPAVPANKIRTIYFIKAQQSGGAAPITIILTRDGATGADILDTLCIPGIGAAQTGKPFKTLGQDIEMPVYTLREGESIGAQIAAGTASLLYTYYDEEG